MDSIVLDPALYDYTAPGNACPVCFAPGQTPATLFACYFGIQIGSIWLPTDPPPPNGIYELSASAPCVYGCVLPDPLISLQWTGGHSAIQSLIAGGGLFFVADSVPACNYIWPNSFNSPLGRRYWCGYCCVINCLPGGVQDEGDLIDWLDASIYSQIYSKPVTLDQTHIVHRLSRPYDRSNIFIKIDHS